MTLNLATQDPKWAWHEMTDTYWAQGALKAAAGVESRGRKNTKPVLHYTLAWAEADNPTPEIMKQAVKSSLTALGLDEHEALVAAHTDKKHPHVHIIVNTVHPQTGRTADLKFSKLALSRWAEAYERENGVHCEERIKNNAERDNERDGKRRNMDPTALLMGQRPDPSRLLMAGSGVPSRGRVPRPRPQKSDNRKIWLDKKDVVDRMKRMRAEQEVFHKIDRNTTWTRHRAERDALWENTLGAIRQANAYVSKKYKPQWRELYKLQREEMKFIQRSTPLERAIFVIKNRERLGNWKPLSKREMHRAIANPGRLMDLVDATHARERAQLSQVQKVEAHGYTGKIQDDYARRHDALLSRQTDERQAERLEQFKESRQVTFKDARDSLIDDLGSSIPDRDFKLPPRADVSADFNEAAPDPINGPSPAEQQKLRAEEIRREMDAWRKKNKGRDFGREM